MNKLSDSKQLQDETHDWKNMYEQDKLDNSLGLVG